MPPLDVERRLTLGADRPQRTEAPVIEANPALTAAARYLELTRSRLPEGIFQMIVDALWSPGQHDPADLYHKPQ
jgi:hypothetical protein